MADDEAHVEPEPPGPITAGRDDVPDSIRAVSFHTAVRGYDRREVDRYVEKVNRVIAELQITRSPESAVRHALDRVGEQTSGILQHARETADDITHTARSEAEETTARAKAEARDIIADARAEAERTRAEADATLARAESEARDVASEAKRRAEGIVAAADAEAAERRRDAENEMRELRGHIDGVREQRANVLGEIRELAARLERLAAPEPESDESAPPGLDATAS